jgi:hypothetical protein
MKIFCVILLSLFAFSVFAQEKPDDLQKVKDALVNQVLKTQELEKKNAEMANFLSKFGDELKAVKTIQQLDSLKILYGLTDPKAKK